MRIGFRTWTLIDGGSGFSFRSVAIAGNIWKLIGANQALTISEPLVFSGLSPQVESEHGKPIQPKKQNAAGLYHYYDAEKAATEYASLGFLGACMCWGEIGGKDGERMFRSEFAQIVAVTEPLWASYFPKPSAPSPPQTVREKLWMAAVSKERARLLDSPERFGEYVLALARVLGIDSTGLDVSGMHDRFQVQRHAVAEEYANHLRAIADWEAKLRTWDKDHSTRFRASMPFPVFQGIPELVSYARKFGELGPPSRTLN